jgi:hypothetical protein
MSLLIGTVVIALLSAVVAVQAISGPHDGQAALALVALPLLQWVVLVSAVSLAVVFRTRPA